MSALDDILNSSAGEMEALAAVDSAISELESARNLLRATVDTKRLAARPSFPIGAQLEGIREAARRLRENFTGVYSTGSACGPAGDEWIVFTVQDAPRQARIYVDHSAPERLEPTGGKLWSFTEAETQALADYITSSVGLHIVGSYPTANGVTYTVTEGETA